MILLLLILGCFVVGFLITRKTERPGKRKGIMGIFDRLATGILYNRLLGRPFRKKSEEVDRNLERLHPGENSGEIRLNYTIRKLSVSLLLLFAGTVFALAVKAGIGSESVVRDNSVKRQDYAGNDTVIALTSEAGDFSVTVGRRELTLEEADALYEEYREKLYETVLGENTDFSELQKDLRIVKELDQYPFRTEWTTSDWELISGQGKVADVETAQEAELRLVTTYLDWEWEEVISARVVPAGLSAEEAFWRKVQRLLTESEHADRTEVIWELPTEMDGSEIHFSEAKTDYSAALWVGVLVLAIVLFFLKDKDLAKDVEKRKGLLLKAYPGFLQKILLYLEAGMTLRGAMERIAFDLQSGGRGNPLGEELIYSCREMKSGISEGEAYGRFGRRTGLQEYIRFSTLMEQNLKRGSSSLIVRLREELSLAVQAKMQNCKRISEEATTKLLVPMVLFLLMVMIMIIMPAFSNMNV